MIRYFIAFFMLLGSYTDGAFHPIRILNGDETDWGGPAFGEKPTLLRISLVTR